MAWGTITPRRWQAEALPLVLDSLSNGGGGVVSAFMGSGKSILQAEVVAQRMALGPVLVTAPLRKLVEQLGATIADRVGADNVGRFFTDAKEHHKPVVIACHDSLPLLSSAGIEWGTWIADECHKTESDTVLSFARAANSGAIVGFSATPFRRELIKRLSLYSHTIFSYTGADAVRDGVCVGAKPISYTGDLDDDADLDRVCLDLISRHGDGPGVCNAYDIADAESFASILNAHGIRTRAVHSRQRKGTQRENLAMLQAGELDCVTYCTLLAEGVDMPWLRWMCLRRSCGSRVRFLQETGRVLRTHAEKDYGLVLDPHDLFGTFAMSYDAMLGANDPHEPQNCDDCEEFVRCSGCGKQLCVEHYPIIQCGKHKRVWCRACGSCCAREPEPKERRAQLVTASERWLRGVALALYYSGHASQKAKAWSTARKGATPPQLNLIKRIAPNLRRCEIDAEILEQLRDAYRLRGSLTRRGASDLIDAISATVTLGRWPIEE